MHYNWNLSRHELYFILAEQLAINMVLRSLLFSLYMLVVTVIFSLFSIFTMLVEYNYRYKVLSKWSLVIIKGFSYICKVQVDVSRSAIEMPSTPYIIVSKHQSAWETIYTQLEFPIQTWVLKKELLYVPFFGWALRSLRPIAIDRKARNSAQQLVTQGRSALDNGTCVVIYPEGTRVNVGEKRRYSKSGFLLAAKTSYPIVPVAHNAGTCWPTSGWFKSSGTISVHIGAPITVNLDNIDAVYSETVKWIEEHSR